MSGPEREALIRERDEAVAANLRNMQRLYDVEQERDALAAREEPPSDKEAMDAAWLAYYGTHSVPDKHEGKLYAWQNAWHAALSHARLTAHEEPGRMQSLNESQVIANAQIGRLEGEVERLRDRLAALKDTERPSGPTVMPGRCGLTGRDTQKGGPRVYDPSWDTKP